MKKKITRKNTKYQKKAIKFKKTMAFKEGKLVWIEQKKERFPVSVFRKLKFEADGPIIIIKKIYDNA